MRIVISSVFVLGAACSGPDERLVADEVCGFSISMPGNPTCSDTTTNAPIGTVTEHACRVTIGRRAGVWIAGCTSYPAVYVDRVKDPDGMLRAAIQGEVESSHGHVASMLDIEQHGFRGKDAIVEAGDSTMSTRVLIDGLRIYHFGIVAPRGTEIADEAAKFFASVKLRR